MTGTNEKKQKLVELLSEGKVNEALELVDTEDKKILYEMGQTAQDEKDHNLAERVYCLLTELDPNDDKAWMNRGRVLGNLEREKEAVHCYDEVFISLFFLFSNHITFFPFF